MADDSYVCSLKESTLKKAKKELGEDPKERLGAVQTFREWILQQKHIKCDTDTLFLLRFLRYAKWSQLRARKALEDYLTCFMTYKKWFHNIDTHSPGINAFLKTGYLFSGGEDDDNQIIYGCALGRLDPDNKAYNNLDVMRACVAVFYLDLYNEENMVNGYNYLIDATGYNLKHQTYYGLNDLVESEKMWQKAFPQRYKGFHYYNGGPLLDALMKLLKPVMSKKWQERLHFHSTMVGVYKHIPKRCLPLDYLPDDYKGESPGSLDQLAEEMHARMTSQKMRDRILYLTSPDNFYIDLKEKVDVPNESFRKLNVD